MDVLYKLEKATVADVLGEPETTWSSSRAPLLAPSPLRTGLEGFPFIRLEHPKTPPMNNEDVA